MNVLSVVAISILKVCMQTTCIPLSHSHKLPCSVLCASYYTFQYVLKHRMMLADMSLFVAALCVCFASLHEASCVSQQHAATKQSATQLACDDAHGFLVVAWCLELSYVDVMCAMHACHQ